MIVTSYTYTMSCATTPDNPQYIFEKLAKPCALYIGNEDEQFDPVKVTEFARYNKKGLVSTQIIPQVKHLSILLNASEFIGSFLA